jgi:hypothetical protein
MTYKITSNYCFHNSTIVDMYFINGIPFTFDSITTIMEDDPYVIMEAKDNVSYESKDMYNWSNYLIMEECHPLIYELELENPEEMPKD